MHWAKKTLLIAVFSTVAAFLTAALIVALTGPGEEAARPPAARARPGPTQPSAPPSADPKELAAKLNSADPAERATAGTALAILGKPALPHIADALPQSPTIAARIDAVTVLAQIGGPEILPALVKSLENIPDNAGKPDELQTMVSDIMTGLGNHDMDALSAAAIETDCCMLAKEAAARACVRIGKQAVGHVSGHILKWNVFPHPDELRLWLRTLGEIGHPGADLALEHAASQNIEGIKELVAETRRKIAAK